jgi:pilus assembly protein CpaE
VEAVGSYTFSNVTSNHTISDLTCREAQAISGAEEISIVIIDKCQDSISHITNIIHKVEKSASILHSAGTIWEGYEVICRTRPKFVIINVQGEGINNNLQVISKIRRQYPLTFICVFLDAHSPETILKFLRAGASECLPIPVSATDLSAVFLKFSNSRREVRDIEEEHDTCETYSIFSSKNGAGTTTIAVNLASNIFEITKKPTIVVDLDLIGGDVSTFLDLKPRYNIGDVKQNIDSLDDCLLRSIITRHTSGISVLTSPQNIMQGLSVSGADVRKLLSVLKTMFKYIVIDTEANFTAPTVTAISMSDFIFMPVIQSLPSIKNTQLCMNYLNEIGIGKEKIRLVANMYLAKAKIGLDYMKDILDHPVYCCIPNDSDMAMECINKGVTFSAHAPRSKANSALRDLATILTCRLTEAGTGKKEIKSSGINKLLQTTSETSAMQQMRP